MARRESEELRATIVALGDLHRRAEIEAERMIDEGDDHQGAARSSWAVLRDAAREGLEHVGALPPTSGEAGRLARELAELRGLASEAFSLWAEGSPEHVAQLDALGAHLGLERVAPAPEAVAVEAIATRAEHMIEGGGGDPGAKLREMRLNVLRTAVQQARQPGEPWGTTLARVLGERFPEVLEALAAEGIAPEGHDAGTDVYNAAWSALAALD